MEAVVRESKRIPQSKQMRKTTRRQKEIGTVYSEEVAQTEKKETEKIRQPTH